MPDYKTGTYIIKTKKVWECNFCGKEIKIDEQVFARIKEYGNKKFRSDGITAYRLKIYKRFHLGCAKKLEDLNSHEQALLTIQKAEINSAYGKSSKITDIVIDDMQKILGELEKLGYKAVYRGADTILLEKTGVALDTP